MEKQCTTTDTLPQNIKGLRGGNCYEVDRLYSPSSVVALALSDPLPLFEIEIKIEILLP